MLGLNLPTILLYLLPLQFPSQTSYPALARTKAGALSLLCIIQQSAESVIPCYKKTTGAPDFVFLSLIL